MVAPKQKEATIFDLRLKLAERTGLTVAQANQIIWIFLGIIKGELAAGRPVMLRELGRFGFRVWTGRQWPGRSYLPSRLSVKFQASKSLKRMTVNLKPEDVIHQKPATRRHRPAVRKVSIIL